MQPLFYSTGQVARQLGTTPAAVRLLCETGAIAAEMTPGGQWRVSRRGSRAPQTRGPAPDSAPLATRERSLARQRDERPQRSSRTPAEPSDEVATAADEVAITRSRLEKRKIERDLEENEDWFRARTRRQAEAEAAERQKAEVRQAGQQRQKWMQEWLRYALNSVPYGARREVEGEVHAEVQEALSRLQPSQPEVITQRLVDAAVHRALRPWNRKQEIERAHQAGMNKLALDVRYRSEYAGLKQRAWEAVVAAVGKVRVEAGYNEMETAAVQAVQPMIREYEHQKACEDIVQRVYISGATGAEEDAAKEAVREALAALPIGAAARQLEKAEETALARCKAAVTARKEKARRESEEPGATQNSRVEGRHATRPHRALPRRGIRLRRLRGGPSRRGPVAAVDPGSADRGVIGKPGHERRGNPGEH